MNLYIVPSRPDYAASSDGRVFRVTPCKRFKVLPHEMKQRVDRDGYLMCGPSMKVHRLVAEAFHPNPNCKPAVAHCNGDKTDNRAVNLRWVTAAENNADKIAHGTHVFGERSASSKLTAAMVTEARAEASRGVSHTTLAARYGVDRSVLSRAVKGKTWRHV